MVFSSLMIYTMEKLFQFNLIHFDTKKLVHCFILSVFEQNHQSSSAVQSIIRLKPSSDIF